MDQDAHHVAGVAYAAMHLHIVVFGALLKTKALTPEQVRETLDAAMLAYEGGHGSNIPDLGSVASHAREQIQHLLETLEATSPEMKANPPSP
jgi:hypothetical protein